MEEQKIISNPNFSWFINDFSLYYGINDAKLLEDFGINLSTHINCYKSAEISKEKGMPIICKISKNGLFCAVFVEGTLWADFYKISERDFVTDAQKKLIEMGKIPKLCGKYLFTLRRNEYYTEGTQFLLEFGEIIENNEKKTVFLFNTKHGNIDVYDMTGKIVLNRSCGDIFFVQFYKNNEKYMVADVWYWAPVEGVMFYDLEKLFNDKEYQGDHIATDGYTFFDGWVDKEKCIYKLTSRQIYEKNKCITENPLFDAEAQLNSDNEN